MDIIVRIGRDIRLEPVPRGMAERLVAAYTVPNPDYYKLERMGKWTGNTPKELALWQRDGQTLILPYGCLQDAINTLNQYGVPFDTVCEAFCGDSTHDYKSNINLYLYQENAVEAVLTADSGVLVAPCGSGKTQMGLEIAARLGLKTLWLTHTHELLNQSMSRAKACFDLAPQAYGTITAGKVEIGEVITFATVQTMAKLDLKQYADVWGCVIVDEAHRVAGSPTKIMQFSKVLGNLAAKHKYGLTATPKRADGLIKCMYAYIGPKLYEINSAEVGDKTCPVRYQQIPTGWDCDIDAVTNPDGTLDYVRLVNNVCRDFRRNEQITQFIKDCAVSTENRILVLSERVNHVQELAAMFNDCAPIDCMTLYGSTKKKDRERCLLELRSGACRVLFATYQLAKEGLDIPELTHLVLASPNKTDTTIIQSVGRVARACDSKDHGIVIDFVDDFMPLQTWARKRERIYKKLGYEPL